MTQLPAFSRLKSEGDLLEWAVTALFYTSLHLLQVCLIDMAQHAFDYPRSHADRDSFIFRKLRHLSRDYNFLQTRCNEARYHPDKPRPTLQEIEQYEANQFARIVAEASQRGYPLQP